LQSFSGPILHPTFVMSVSLDSPDSPKPVPDTSEKFLEFEFLLSQAYQ